MVVFKNSFRLKHQAFLILALFSCFQMKAVDYTVKSPDKNITIEISNKDGVISYTLLKNDETLINASKISLLTGVHSEIKSTSKNYKNEIWNPVWGQFSEIRNEYNELTLNIDLKQAKAKIIVRVFNTGIGFRYELEGYEAGTEADLFTEYNLSNKDVLYCPAGENDPLGPIKIETFNSSNTLPKLMTPLVIEHSGGTHLSILESDLYTAPEFGAIKFKFDPSKKIVVSSNKIKLEGRKLTTPWRVILVEEKVGDLVTNTIPLNLATPNQIEDTSWIKPGKTLWDWRVHDYVTADGFTYGINNESYYRFINFAAEKNIKYFLIDANWYTKVTKGHFDVADGLDLEKVSKYAESKGVKLILYYDRHKGNYGDKELFPYFNALGMSGIKYGFMGNNVSFSKDAIMKSAENQLIVNFHDSPVPFTGIERTFPNAVTREYCHAQQDSRKAFTPETFIKMALINAIQGPLDMNNGNFDLIGINKGDRLKGPKKENTYFSTVASEAARTLVIFSGLVCLPDAPEAYTKKADLFEFIEKMPAGEWNESRVLYSKMDSYISTARRHGDQWFVGSVYNKQGGNLDIVLDFIKEGVTYNVTYYEDTSETHGMNNPEAYQVRRGTVKKGDVINAKMAPGGGHCMWIRPE